MFLILTSNSKVVKVKLNFDLNFILVVAKNILFFRG